MLKLKGKELKPEWEAFIHSENDNAFYVLYNHYFHYLYYIGLKKGFAASRVKDTINEVFLYLWENRIHLQPILHHHNYIITAFLRKLYRNEHFSSNDSLELDSNSPEFGASPSPEQEYIVNSTSAEVKRMLQAYVNQLPDRQRSMIYQKFYLGLSYNEIAESNNVSINTVYNTVYNAMDNLRKLIGRENLNALLIATASIISFFLFFF